MKEKKTSARTSTARRKRYDGFSDEERAAMKDAVREQKAGEANDESEVLAKIAEMQESDRVMAERLHALIKASAPELSPRTWYGMPAYAKNGNIICHFQPAKKFKTRYATLGFSDKANLDEGALWPVAYALPQLTPAAEARVGELVRKAVS